ncbi:riboflavin synthase [Haloglomus irregulare]|jgi:riboflavin synthase|uniref:Riboflavin synthase n=1 Tax=Haloglomus irregulare TaxID=2234134 RepID=A0A554MWC0_9EURY|nr:riboflavin synthase [Haloglomus irregulare]TSD09422.1 riboflavin synthase [Haloglomus irregulare]
MFTGIVAETGEILSREETADGLRLRVGAPFAAELEHGESIAVSGACLTVEAHDAESFELFCSEETVERTYLGSLDVGDVVNLERALPADGRFDGHFVQGHVDGTARVTGVEQIGDDWTFSFSLPRPLAKYVVEKGSIAVDGISLTVADLTEPGTGYEGGAEGAFDVAVIPATYDITNLHDKAVGDPVHLEVDVVAKYVESLTEGYLGD